MTTTPSPLITDRPPTRRDEDERGEVIYLQGNGWVGAGHEWFETGRKAIKGWTHTPLWVDPGPTLEEQLEKDLTRLQQACGLDDSFAAHDRIAAYVRQQLKANSEAS